MTDFELNILMQSLSDEELGSMYAALPASADAAAADRIANKFYAKCAAAGTPVLRPRQKARPRIKVKYLGFSAAACVAVAASAAAYYSSQTEKPGVMPETTAVTAESTTTYTETVTTVLTVQQTASGTSGTQKTTAPQTTASAVQTTESAVQTAAASGTSAAETVNTTVTTTAKQTAVTRTASQTASTQTSTTTQTTTTQAQLSTTLTTPTTTRVMTTTPPHEETYATCATTIAFTSSPGTMYTAPETTDSEYYTTTAAAPSKGDISTDHAAVWLVHAPFCNTYHVGEEIDLSGTRLGVWYMSCDKGVMENDSSVLLSEHPEMFTVDASAYRADRPGTYAIRVIYDRGKTIGSRTPAAAKSVNIYVTVIE